MCGTIYPSSQSMKCIQFVGIEGNILEMDSKLIVNWLHDMKMIQSMVPSLHNAEV
jgi:hypothetical protein